MCLYKLAMYLSGKEPDHRFRLSSSFKCYFIHKLPFLLLHFSCILLRTVPKHTIRTKTFAVYYFKFCYFCNNVALFYAILIPSAKT